MPRRAAKPQPPIAPPVVEAVVGAIEALDDALEAIADNRLDDFCRSFDTMFLLTREAFDALSQNLPTKTFPVRDGEACIRMLTGGDKDAIEAATSRIEGDTVVRDLRFFRAHYNGRSLCDADGNLLYNVDIPAELAAVAGLPGDIADEVFKQVRDFNMLTPKAVEDAEKN